MIEFLQKWDIALFRWVNDGWSNSTADAFFSFITESRHFAIPILIAVIGLLWKGGVKGRFVVLALLLSLALSDPLAIRVIKPLVKRTRPCNELTSVRIPHGGSTAYSFPSAHATNMGAVAAVFSMAYPFGMPYFVAGAGLVGLSRIYLGLHYPSDVLAGFLLGAWAGFLCWRLSEKWRGKWIARRTPIVTGAGKRK